MENSICHCYFVNEQGLFKVYCSFIVICIVATNNIYQGDLVIVTAVKSSKEGFLVFEINGEYYYHHYFQLYSN